MPGRDGGRRKKPDPPLWAKRVSHAVPLSNLINPVETRRQLGYSGRFREPLASAAYRLDQAFATAKIPYSVTAPDSADYLLIVVGEADLESSRKLLMDLQKGDAAV
jgi:hypothetical protein